ncbi:condensation domain-containing protein [Streptomyces sp. NPDC101175]|uniref:non-ribosomal peptide synthetase n=1 Tax=Streptomyces sp. NPDC101175 TaxID=3366123 RepID=UPI003839CE76
MNHAKGQEDHHSRVVRASSAQRRMYFSSIVRTASSADTWGTALTCDGDFDTSRLERALQVLRGRHETLRTTFLERDGEVLQVVHDANGAVSRSSLLDIVEAEGDSHSKRCDWAEDEAGRLLDISFDISSGPLWKASAIRVSSRLHLIVFVFHHIIIDEISAQVFAEELRLAYADADALAVAAPAVQYADFCLAENASGVDPAGLDYWRGQLEGIQSPQLPEDSREDPGLIVGSRIPVAVPGNVVAEFEEFCKDRSITPFMGMLAAYFILLQSWAGSSDIAVGTPVLSRPDSDFFRTIGFFANTVVLRCPVAPTLTFDQFLEHVSETVLDALEYQDVPFEAVVEDISPHRDADRNPLFQAAIGYGTLDPSDTWELDGLQVTPMPGPMELSRIEFDLRLDIQRLAHETSLTIEYNRQRFSEAAMRRFAHTYGNLLQSLSRAPDVPLGSIPVLDQVALDETLVLGASGDTQDGRAPAECTSAWDLFELTAMTVPEREAVVADEERLTFAELAGRARTMATALRARGVRSGTMVGICLPRRSDLIVAMLAVWGAGGAFLLLDPEQDEARRRLLEEAGIALAVSDERFAEVETVSAAALLADLATAGGGDSTHGVDAARRPATAPACMLFTAGSTGQPKGVVIDQASLVALATTQLAPMYARLPEGRQVNVGALSSVTFDVFINQCLGMIAFGHRLLLIDEEERTDPLRLLARGADPESSIDVFNCNSSQMESLVDAGLLTLPYPPKMVVIGGESTSGRLWRRLRDQPGLLAFATYGLTECTADSARAEIGEHAHQVAGRAGGAAQIYIVDDQLQLLPPTFVGEICIGGLGVAQGYVGEPAYTSERFIADPFSRVPGQRMYLTGDKGRLRPDGQLEFWGRLADQVTVRGLRVEPGELEALLDGHPAIARSAVIATDPGTDMAQLVAYVVPGDGGRDGLTYSAVREFLRGKLPSALLPDRVEVLEEFPVAFNGKLDRRALSGIESSGTLLEAGQGTTLLDIAREQRLCEIVAEVVGAPQAGPDDNFWVLGGNSLLAMQVIDRVRTTLGCELSIRAIFEADSLGDMAVQLVAVDDSTEKGDGR